MWDSHFVCGWSVMDLYFFFLSTEWVWTEWKCITYALFVCPSIWSIGLYVFIIEWLWSFFCFFFLARCSFFYNMPSCWTSRQRACVFYSSFFVSCWANKQEHPTEQESVFHAFHIRLICYRSFFSWPLVYLFGGSSSSFPSSSYFASSFISSYCSYGFVRSVAFRMLRVYCQTLRWICMYHYRVFFGGCVCMCMRIFLVCMYMFHAR